MNAPSAWLLYDTFKVYLGFFYFNFLFMIVSLVPSYTTLIYMGYQASFTVCVTPSECFLGEGFYLGR